MKFSQVAKRIDELALSKKNRHIAQYAHKLGFAIIDGEKVTFPWNKTGNEEYEKWLLKQLKNAEHAEKGLVNGGEDNGHLEDYISFFDRLKKQKQVRGVDINSLDFPALKHLVDQNKNKASRKSMERGDVGTQAKGDFKMHVYKGVEDTEKVAEWGEKASEHTGGRGWCTSSPSTAQSYLKKGAIYVVSKRGKPYAQMHVETKSFMQPNDSPLHAEHWKEMKANIPAVAAMVRRFGIIRAMASDEVNEWVAGLKNFKGNLSLQGTQVTKLPDNLVISGSLDLQRTLIKELPPGLKVAVDLNISNTEISSLPPIIVKGEFHLSKTSITSFPAGIEIGNLKLHDTNVTSLPDGLKISKTLDLEGSAMVTLPNNLHVGEDLRLAHTKISTLPSGLFVGSNADLTGTPITTVPADMIVRGDLDLGHTKVKVLPNNLKITGGYLSLEEAPIYILPAGLEVSEDLDLTGTAIKNIPADLKVGGDLYMRKDVKTPPGFKVGGAIHHE